MQLAGTRDSRARPVCATGRLEQREQAEGGAVKASDDRNKQGGLRDGGRTRTRGGAVLTWGSSLAYV